MVPCHHLKKSRPMRPLRRCLARRMGATRRISLPSLCLNEYVALTWCLFVFLGPPRAFLPSQDLQRPPTPLRGGLVASTGKRLNWQVALRITMIWKAASSIDMVLSQLHRDPLPRD